MAIASRREGADNPNCPTISSHSPSLLPSLPLSPSASPSLPLPSLSPSPSPSPSHSPSLHSSLSRSLSLPSLENALRADLLPLLQSPSLFNALLTYSEELRSSSLSAHFLLQIWTSVSDSLFRILTDRKVRPPGDSESEASWRTEDIIDCLVLFFTQCPELPYDEFWTECCRSVVSQSEPTETFIQHFSLRKKLIKALLELMASREKILFLKSVDRRPLLYFLILDRVIIGSHGASNSLSEIWETFELRRAIHSAFKVVLELFQMDSFEDFFPMPEPIFQNAWKVLRELRDLEEDEWMACFNSVIFKILLAVSAKGRILLRKGATSRLLLLLSRPSLSYHLLESLIKLAELEKEKKKAYECALQIFEEAYRRSPALIASHIAARLADERSENAALRVECLHALSRLHENSLDEALSFHLHPHALQGALRAALFDPSVRVRRVSLLLLSRTRTHTADSLYAIFLKLRDTDSTVCMLAFKALAKFPMKLLFQRLKDEDWQLIFKIGLQGEHKKSEEIKQITEDLLLKFLISDEISDPPSSRLKRVGFLKRENMELYGRVLQGHVSLVAEKEVAKEGGQ